MSGERGILIVPEYSYCPASGSQSGIVLAPVFDSVSRGTEFATGSEKDLITSLKNYCRNVSLIETITAF
jgi:hypothetical protein